MTMILEKGKDASVKCAAAGTDAPETSPKKHGQYNKIWTNWKARQRSFLVRSAEQNDCPCCNGALHVIGSRRRVLINDQGEKIILIIRRLRCSNCGRIHHELPDILIPYKRYSNASIESVLSEDIELTVAADESTIRHWKNWFRERYYYFLGCLLSIAIRYDQDTAEGMYSLPSICHIYTVCFRIVSGFSLNSNLTQLTYAWCDFCSSDQKFASGFLQIPPRGGHPCPWLCAWHYQPALGTFTH